MTAIHIFLHPSLSMSRLNLETLRPSATTTSLELPALALDLWLL